jgi:ATP-binding cassette subfamily B protein
VISWTLAFLRPYRTRVLAIAVLSLAEIGVAALAPWPLKIVVDSVLGDHPLPEPFAGLIASTAGARPVALLVIVVVAGLLLQVAGELLRTIQTQLQVDTGQRIVYGLRARLLAHLQDLPLRHHIVTRTADSVYRLDADAHCVDDLVIGGVFPLAAAALNLGVMFVILVYLDPALGLLSLAVVPALYLCLRYYSRTMTDRAGRVKELESTLLERAFEILSSIAAVKSFTRERHELTRYSQSGDEALRARLSLTWQESLFSVAVTVVTLAGTALVLIVGGLHVLDGRLTVGSLLVVIAYLAAVYNPISAIAHTTGSLQQAIVSARRVSEIFALTPETFDALDALDASSVAGHVRFESVSFSYDGSRQVLEDVSFEAHPDELIALVGITGAGKTTIASLVPRFFEPTHGRVLVDDVDVSRYSLRSLRERIALVPQQPVLFSSTIADNIRYGRLQASDEEVEAAARAAQLHDVIEQLPDGYQTPVAEAGATLSGGERQRLGIARALVKNAPILILDEPTSSLDALSEAAVFEALRRLRRGRTTIVIAHRLSTIRNATRIIVLHEGRIVAQGRHDELMAANILYRRMCARLSVGLSLDEPEAIDELVR